jgi:hypothetical protein
VAAGTPQRNLRGAAVLSALAPWTAESTRDASWMSAKPQRFLFAEPTAPSLSPNAGHASLQGLVQIRATPKVSGDSTSNDSGINLSRDSCNNLSMYIK